ncbi:MAG TPA: hypothetical protein VIL09_18895 [Microvirga sp.]
MAGSGRRQASDGWISLPVNSLYLMQVIARGNVLSDRVPEVSEITVSTSGVRLRRTTFGRQAMRLFTSMHAVAGLATAAALYADAAYSQERLEPAERFFIEGPHDVPISIRLPPGQTLVFDEKFNDRYLTKGRELRAGVSKVHVVGNVPVRIRLADLAPPAQTGIGADGGYPQGGNGGDGRPGETGPEGLPGSVGWDITVEANEVTGDGKIILVTVGQTGGRGCNGGKGGDRRNRKDSGVCCFPPSIISGDPPGNCATGGQAGRGGQGGPAARRATPATCTSTRSFAQSSAAKKVVFELAGVSGGPGGPGGEPGSPRS